MDVLQLFAISAKRDAGAILQPGISELKQAVIEVAGMRVRPVMVTVAAIIAGLLPIMYGSERGLK